MQAIKTSVTVFATMIGMSLSRMPYKSQRDTPAAKIENVTMERSLTFLVLYIFTICGTNDIVQRVPAIIPTVNVTISSSRR